MATPEQIDRAVNTIKANRKAHRPRRGGGFNSQISEEIQARLDALTHGHCAGCSALTIDFENGVALKCKVGYSPVKLWRDKDLIGVPLSEEPQCLGYDGN